MSHFLWKYYLQDDLDSFRQLLATASFSGTSSKTGVSGAVSGFSAGSPGRGLSTSPTWKSKSKSKSRASTGIILTRADLNSKDSHGVTLLHHMASSSAPSAPEFALALLQAPLLDLYAQDFENGWTSLHRALYFGNITIARALMVRDIEDAVTVNAATHAGGLIKIKDKEGNSPFDVYGTTIASRIIQHAITQLTLAAEGASDNDDGSSDDSDDTRDGANNPLRATTTFIDGDELYTFGSNRNYSLGFPDEDDRQFPERPAIQRPLQLMQKFYAEYLTSMTESASIKLAGLEVRSLTDMPALVRSKPLHVLDVQLSKLHTAVLTTDPENNLYVCGFGPGGRLGTGNALTKFTFTSIQGGGLASKKVNAIALGQNHSLAVTADGETYSWGSNVYGQLGYALGKELIKEEDQVQLLSRQIFGPLKREFVVGCAASRTHSVVHTGASLFTFGKNDGQLGLVDADARSLETQVIPRKVAASLFSSTIVMVSAIDNATICLLENHDVWVFANYGYSKVLFPLDGFSSQFASNSFFGSRRSGLSNYVIKVCSGGSTICALSSEGEVYTINLKSEPATAAASTTNPAKIRAALSAPQNLWSLRKTHMAAIDVDVGQDGSVVICTAAGSVWKREKRAKIKDTSRAGGSVKDYKFSRVPGLTRVVAVRSSTFGAFAAIRKDTDVLQTQVIVEPSCLWKDMLPLLPLHGLVAAENSDTEEPVPRFWRPRSEGIDAASIRKAIVKSTDIEGDLQGAISSLGSFDNSNYDVKLGTTLSDVHIPCHSFLLAARSECFRNGLHKFSQDYFFSIPDAFVIEYDKHGHPVILFQGLDILTLLNIVFHIYTDGIIDVWHLTKIAPKFAYTYRQVRNEVMKIAALLDLKSLERAARLMGEPSKVMNKDLDRTITNHEYFETGDVEIELDGHTRKVHSALICQRCPFFDGLFHGRASGSWLTSRREGHDELDEAIKIDLSHIEPDIFDLVVRYLYADVGEELFESVKTSDLDTLLDLILDVLAVANELMLDRLAEICQKMLGRFVTTRNVCQLLNAVAPCSVTEFKNAALEYICLNLEGMLENRLLDELDEDLMMELDIVVRENQLTMLPISKSGRAEAELFERYPELAAKADTARQIKIDSMTLQSRLHEDEVRAEKLSRVVAASKSPQLRARISSAELLFNMDEDALAPSNTSRELKSPVLEARKVGRQGSDASQPYTSPHRAWSSNTFKNGSEALSPLPFTASVPEFDLSSPFATPKSSETPSKEAGPSHVTRVPSSPWSVAPLGTPKLDMKQIMAQTSESRQSNISNAILRASSGSVPRSGSAGKLSQKERKRQQQQQKQDITAFLPKSSPLPAAQSRTSAWQVAATGPKVSLTEVLNDNDSTEGTAATLPAIKRPSPSPSLTLRQTVPGNTAGARKASSESVPQPKQTQPQRSVSQPTATSLRPSPTPSSSTTQSQSQAQTQHPQQTSILFPPLPRSIQHSLPISPAEPSLQLSMADILVQQQSEKDILKEVTAKRSLLEIQEEQAFQEWWDQEEKATKARLEDEEAVKARRDQRSRGMKRGSRGGRGGKKPAASAPEGEGKGKAKAKGKQPEGEETKEGESSRRPESSAKPERGGSSRRGRRGG